MHIHSGYIMTLPGQTTSRDRPDVPKPKNTDLHEGPEAKNLVLKTQDLVPLNPKIKPGPKLVCRKWREHTPAKLPALSSDCNSTVSQVGSTCTIIVFPALLAVNSRGVRSISTVPGANCHRTVQG